MQPNYFKQREPNDIDLIKEVRNILISSGLGQRMNAYDSSRFITSAIDKCPEVQRYSLNRYFALQLNNCNKNSTDERFCLIPNGEISEWLIIFKAKIVPFLIENELPKLI